MESLWFVLVAATIATYVALDGFDLGAGIAHLIVGRSPADRSLILRTIGPVWDGNEVWLLAAGGTLYFAFPPLYAAGLSGFYLPLMIVLWLLILRGVAIEFRHHLAGPVWAPFWDAVFALASTLLAFTFGAALGNVVRGVPLDRTGSFFVPLWTDFHPGREPGVLDWYTITAGLAAVAALGLHGGLWVAMKSPEPVATRARRFARHLGWAAIVLTILLTGATFYVQPHIPVRLATSPWGLLFPALAVAGLAAALRATARRADATAFLSSTAYLAGMLGSVFFGLYPLALPSTIDPSLALTVHDAAAGAYGLRVGLVWWIPGMGLVTAYFVFSYRRLAGRIPLESIAGDA